MANYYRATQSSWRGRAGVITPGTVVNPPTGGWSGPGKYQPSTTLYGSSIQVPAATNTSPELDQYRSLTRLEMLDYIQTEFTNAARAAGSTMPVHSNSNPLFQALHAFHPSGDGIPSSFNAAAGGLAQGCINRNLICALSVHGNVTTMGNGGLDAQIAALVQSCPTDRTTYLIFNHEPENVTVNGTTSINNYTAEMAAAHRRAVARAAYAVIQARGTTYPVVPTFCYIHNFISPNRRSGPPADYDNPMAEVLALGVDPDEILFTTDGYTTTANGVSAAQARTLYESTVDRIRSWGWKRYGVSEGAAKSYTTSDRAAADDWMRAVAEIARAQRWEYFLWFNSGVGGRANEQPANEGWWIYGDANKAQYARIARNLYPVV